MSKDLEVSAALAELGTEAEYSERVQFQNGRGVSIIRNRWSYGGKSGLFEVAVLDASGELDYSTPVTGDVLGYLNPSEVVDVMRQVSELPSALEA